ncbi:MAG: PEGA domain-containing protein, partial [Candidatus Competibacter sp.]
AQTPAEPVSPPPPRRPEPEPARPEPVSPPPINLVSVPQPSGQAPAEPRTQVIAGDSHTRLAKTETDDNVSLHVTVSPQGILDDTQRGTSKPQSTPAQLFVRADVDSAEVWINNKKVGTTPLAVDLPPGVYRVRVRQEGHTDWNGRVELAAGDESTLSAILPQKLEVTVATPPPEPEPKPKPEPPRSSTQETRTAAVTPASSGCLSGNCESGQGAYRYPDGSEYTGQFRNAKMYGQGTYIYAGRGEKYVGEWRNGSIDGQGVYYYRSGNRYEGEWRNGHKNGQGAYYYASGDKYVGDFANDQPNGQGVYYYSNGNRYEGEWRNGRKNGQGTLYEGDRKVVGEWQNDQMTRVRVEQ